jgi:hypothetical protein
MDGPCPPGDIDEVGDLGPVVVAGCFMQLVLSGRGQQGPVAGGEPGYEGCNPAQTSYHNSTGKGVGDKRAGFGGGQWMFGDCDYGDQGGMQIKTVNLSIGRTQHQSTESGSRSIVGMRLHLCHQLKDRAGVRLPPTGSPGSSCGGGCCCG